MANANDIAKAYPNAAPIAEDIVNLAKKLGMPDAGWLANLMNFETGGTFSPSIQNKYSNATGLIQFMPDTARSLGTSVDQLKRMSQKEQMYYVEQYLLKWISRGYKNPTDVYMAVFFPAAMGKGGNFSIYDWFVQNRSQNAADKYLQQNNGIRTAQDYADYANKNAKLPTGLSGITVANTSIRILPWIATSSVALLGISLYIKFYKPKWANFLNR